MYVYFIYVLDIFNTFSYINQIVERMYSPCPCTSWDSRSFCGGVDTWRVECRL